MTRIDHAASEMRELTADELSATAGAAHNISIRFGRYTLILQGGDGWNAICIAGPEQYGCLVNAGGSTTTSSGPVPK